MFTHTTMERGTNSDEFGKVPSEQILPFWDEMSKMIEERAGEWLEIIDLQDIFKGIILGVLEAWVAIDDQGRMAGFVICQWEVYPKRKFYNILTICGDGLDTYLDQGLKKIEKYACMGGAYEIILQGRFGWKRKLKKYGYTQSRIQLRKNVRITWSN